MLRVNFILCSSSLVGAHWQEVQVQAAYLTISVYVMQPPDVIVGTEKFLFRGDRFNTRSNLTMDRLFFKGGNTSILSCFMLNCIS